MFLKRLTHAGSHFGIELLLLAQLLPGEDEYSEQVMLQGPKLLFFPSGGLACISREPQGCSVKKKQLQLPFLGPDLVKQEGWL